MRIYLVYETVPSTVLLPALTRVNRKVVSPDCESPISRLSLKGLVIADNSLQATQYFEPEYDGKLYAAPPRQFRNSLKLENALISAFVNGQVKVLEHAGQESLHTDSSIGREMDEFLLEFLLENLPEVDKA